MREIIVVEGRHDAARLKQIHPDLELIITEGSALPEATISMLEALALNHTIVLMLDPDHPGETIRKTLQARIPSARHVFVPKAACIDKKGKKVGIEHASKATLEAALKDHIKTPVPKAETWTMHDLIQLKLSGSKTAASRRLHVAEKLNLGHCNAKTLRNRLNHFGINAQTLRQVLP